jgi:hypothetical protein
MFTPRALFLQKAAQQAGHNFTGTATRVRDNTKTRTFSIPSLAQSKDFDFI